MKVLRFLFLVFLLFGIFSCSKEESQIEVTRGGPSSNTPDDWEELELDTKIHIKDQSTTLLNNYSLSLYNLDEKTITIENKRSSQLNFIIKVFENDGFTPSTNYKFDIDDLQNQTQVTISIPANSNKNLNLKKIDSPTSYHILKILSNYQNFGEMHFNLINENNIDSFNGYYTSIEGKTGSDLRNALNNLVNTTFTKRLTYSECWDGIKYTDEDPNNSNNVILIYTGWSIPKSKNGTDVDGWNREHIWPQSRGNLRTDTTGPGTDLHHLRACDVTVNSSRGNNEFDNGGSIYYDSTPYQGYSTNTGCKKTSNTWEPLDSFKGDIARMIFYMDITYDNKGGKDFVDLVVNELTNNPTTSSSPANIGKLATLKLWHQQDPPDDLEKRRNQRIYEIQGNRNPFIDKPELVSQIFGN